MNYKVLIVEDDPMVAMINSQFVKKVDGFEVAGMCRNGLEAIDFLGENDVDLILLDVFMPVMNGTDTLKKIRTMKKTAEVIMVTAANDTATIEETVHLGVHDYLIKPFTFERFSSSLEKFKAKKQLLEENTVMDQNCVDNLIAQGTATSVNPFASVIKGPHENLDDFLAYLKRQQEIKGVKVVTGQEVDADFIKAEAPDVVILAVGGLRDTLGLESTAGTKVVPIDSVMKADMVGQEVTIVGGSCQAVDMAQFLNAHGKHVTIVSPEGKDKLDKGQSSWVKTFTLPMLYTRGTRLWPNAQIVEVGDGTVTIHGETGVDMTIACDTVIEAMDMLPNKALAEGLDGIEVYCIGDCERPWNIAEAIASGNLTARKI